MKVMMCDRCRKFYREGDGGNVKSIVIYKLDFGGCCSEEPGYFDLCPECLYELVDFLFGLKKSSPPRKLFENTKEEVEHACCCDEKKNNMNADPVKGILDELLKADRVRPLDIHFGDQFFNHYVVKGENEDE